MHPARIIPQQQQEKRADTSNPSASGTVFFRLGAWLLLWALLLTSCSDQINGSSKKGVLTLYGNIDLREVQLAFQDGGRLVRIPVDEGTKVEPGQVVAEIDSVRFQLDIDRLSGELDAQTEVVARLRQGSRPQEIERAKANLEAAAANLKEADLQLKRKISLRETNRISQQEIDSATARRQTMQAGHKAAAEELALIVEGPRKEDIAAAEANLQALHAAKAMAEQRLADTKLLAPARGFIRNRILEPGAMAGAGSPVVTLALIDPLWVRAYISEPDLGRVREGMRAEIQTDTMPGKIYQGWIGFISSTAEFTPKTVETTELRTKLVYRTRVFLCDPQNELRLGMPVTVTVATTQTASPVPAACEQGHK